MSSYLSPAKKGQLNQSAASAYSNNFSPATTTMRKPNQNQTFSTNAGGQTPGKYSNDVEQLLNERNNYKASFHKSEMDLLKTQQELKALQDQIDYYKAKSLASPAKSVYQRELDQTQSSPMRSPYKSQNGASVKEEALEMEISRLRKQLIEKSQQTEDWMKRATRAEVLAKGDINLPEELQIKQQEIDRLNREMTLLQLKSQDVGKLEREIKDLKALLDFKEEENDRLRRDKTAAQLENYKAKQNELSLKDKEVLLSHQVRSLQDNVKENETILKVKEHIFDEKVKEIQNYASAEKQVLQKDLQTVEGLLNHKEQTINEISTEKQKLDQELMRKRIEARQLEQQSSLWKERAGSAEKEVIFIAQKSQQDQEQLKNKLQREHSIERMVLQDKIKTLGNIVSRKEGELLNTQLSLAETAQKKREVELAKQRLQGAVEDLERRNDDTVQTMSVQLKVKDQVYNDQINNLRSSHDFEKERLTRNIDGLRYVADKTMAERDQEKINAMNAQREQMRSAEKQRKAETDAQFWQQQSSHIERQKSREIEQVNNLRKSQIDNLQKSHSKQLSWKDRENENLKYALGTKESNLRDVQYENALTKQQALEKQRLAQQAQLEASLWREKASEEQQKRSLDQQINEDLRRSDNLRSSLHNSAQKLQYQQEVNSLHDMLDRKDQEASDWRGNYHRVLNSKY